MRKVGYVDGYREKNYIKKQFDALEMLNLEVICCERKSKESDSRDDVLEEVIAVLNEGDQLVIYDLSCLGKTLIQLGDFLLRLQEKGITIVIHNKGSQFQNLSNETLMDIIINLASTERKIIKDRTTRGLEVARSDGRVGGRPKISEAMINEIYDLYHHQNLKLREISEKCNVSLGTAYKYAKLD